MDIKVGFADNPRELIIASEKSQDEVVAQINEALRDEAGVLDLTDDKGRRYLVRNARIAYIEVGTSAARTVGFAGA